MTCLAHGTGRQGGGGRGRQDGRRLRPWPDRRGPEDGAMTVALAGVVAAVLLLLCAGTSLAAATVAAHRARAAADLGALAAAVVLQRGGGAGEACARGSAVAALNGAHARGCAAATDGTVVLSTSSVARLSLPGLGRLEARGRARAGPAPPLSPGRSARVP